MYAPLYRKFLAEHNLPETTTFDELSSYEDTKDREHRFSNLKRKFQQWVKDHEVEITVNGVAEFMLGFSDGAKSAGNFADLPYHNVGLKEALKAFSESGIQVPDAKGRTVSGEEALQALRQHPFFETIMRKLEASLHNYDSVIAAEISHRDKTVESHQVAQYVLG